MRTWVKWGGLALTVGAFASSASSPDSALAADHRDGGNLKDVANAPADINDVFTFMDGGDLVLIGSIGGLPSEDFSDAVQYVFHIGRAGDAVTALTAAPTGETLVVCTFDGLDNTTCVVGLEGGDATASVSGDATGDTGMSNDDGTLQIHAGRHKDPFFFFLGGFNAAFDYIDELVPALGGLTNAAGCVDLSADADFAGATDAEADGATIAGAILGMLTGAYGVDGNDLASGPIDNFETNDVSALVVKIDPDLISGTGDFFQVWMSTHEG